MLVGTLEHPVIPPRIWLFVFAIIAHNIPEGMAVGVSAGGGMPDADSLAMGIALQDVPEGLVIALVLAGAGMSRVKAFLIGAASGLVEPVFALLCAWLVSLAEMLLPLGLALAAGAMLLVVTHEVIPESRRNGHDKLASLGLLIGFCLMMVMDTALAVNTNCVASEACSLRSSRPFTRSDTAEPILRLLRSRASLARYKGEFTRLRRSSR